MGVLVTKELQDYTVNNIEPLFTSLKTCTQSWASLPLGVMGRIYCVKMILLTKFLYMFWHSPVLLPLKICKTIRTIFNTFIWASGRHKLHWLILKNPSHFYHLDKTEAIRYQTLVCRQPNRGPYLPLQVIFKEGGQSSAVNTREPLLRYHRCVWELALSRTNTPPLHTHVLLWHNPQLQELPSIPDIDPWA